MYELSKRVTLAISHLLRDPEMGKCQAGLTNAVIIEHADVGLPVQYSTVNSVPGLPLVSIGPALRK